jgi:AcrR family transcriptional regulator
MEREMTKAAPKRAPKSKNTYHHGDLREALLATAEKILRRKGLPALTLRAIARESGVSHGAPAHHFPDLPALVSELAAVGFNRLAERLLAAPLGLQGTGRAYVEFALENPALFALMFREERLDAKNSALQSARARAFSVLGMINYPGRKTLLEKVGAMTATWCMIHGFTVLAIDKRLVRLFDVMPGTNTLSLLDAALADMSQRRSMTDDSATS